MINDQSVLQGIPDNVTISDLSKYIVRTNRNYDLPIIVSAYEFAFQAHGDQKRSSGEPYIVHPLSVAWILVSLGMDTECVCAGLLHDVVEDTGHTLDDICKLFGQNIAQLVDGVTKLVQMKQMVEREIIYKKLYPRRRTLVKRNRKITMYHTEPCQRPRNS